MIKVYGLTRDPITKELAIIMNYCEHKDWKQIIRKKSFPLYWKDRLEMLNDITGVLRVIHKNGCVHGNIHPGNILKTKKYNFLSDLGFCKPANHDSQSGEIYGIVPYMAPEVLRGNPITAESDVYNIGMLMWELSSRSQPFHDRSHDALLIMDICNGARPKIVEGTPKIYTNLMELCWHEDPSKRPTSEELHNIIWDWLVLYKKKKNLEIYKIFTEADNNESNKHYESNKKLRPNTSFTSRPISKHIIIAKTLSKAFHDMRVFPGNFIVNL